MPDLALIIGVLISSAVLTGLVRLYALRSGLIDNPNRRSSHEQPTPRGGGLSIVVAFTGLLILLNLIAEVPRDIFHALLAGGILIGGIGFLDDHRHIPAAYRFLMHLAAAGFFVYMVGELPLLQVGKFAIDLGWVGHAVSVVFLVWLTNLFNFMDGIDGIAAIEAIFIASAAFIISSAEPGNYLMLLEAGLVAGCLGFLVWNWPPAKIFMGDVGSGFLGFTLGTLAIISSNFDDLPIWSWLVLSGVFMIDATVTLSIRILQREDWLSAHRDHAYQKAARRFGSHRRVIVGVVAINVIWLFPIAYAASVMPHYGWWLTITAWAPLIVLSLSFGAGHAED